MAVTICSLSLLASDHKRFHEALIAHFIAQPTTLIYRGYFISARIFMIRPVALITWFRTQLSVGRVLLCSTSPLNHSQHLQYPYRANFCRPILRVDQHKTPIRRKSLYALQRERRGLLVGQSLPHKIYHVRLTLDLPEKRNNDHAKTMCDVCRLQG